jgi:hypothetical protein
MQTEILAKLDTIEIPYEIYWRMLGDSLSKKKREKILQECYDDIDYWLDTKDAYRYSSLFDNRIGIKYCKQIAEQAPPLNHEEKKTIIFLIKDRKKLLKYRLIYGF